MRPASVTSPALQEQVSRNGESGMRALHLFLSNNSLESETMPSTIDLDNSSATVTTVPNLTELNTVGTFPSTISTTTKFDPFSVLQMKMELQQMQLPGLLVSITIILVTMFSCELLYRLILKNVIPGLFRSVVLIKVSSSEK